jgi:hypothetical protein
MTDNLAPAKKIYDQQLEYLRTKDIDNLVENNYVEDAVLLSFDFVVKGRAELKAHFREYLADLEGLKVLSTDKFTATDDMIFFEASVETGKYGVVKVYDAWVMKDDKILRHFTGVK